MMDDFDTIVRDIIKVNKESSKTLLFRLNEGERRYAYDRPFFTDFDPEAIDKHRRSALIHLNDILGIAHILSVLSPKNIIDIACGSGWLAEYLSRLGFEVMGVDISEQFIGVANDRKKCITNSEKLNLTFRCADIHSLDFDKRFDCAILFDALHHLDDPISVLHNIYRLLADTGFIIIKEMVRPPKGSVEEKEIIEAMIKNQWLERPFFREELKSMLVKTGFEYVEELFQLDNLAGVLTPMTVKIIHHAIDSRLGNQCRPNFFVAFKTTPLISYFYTDPNKLRATISPLSLPLIKDESFADKLLNFKFRLQNVGEVSWSNFPTLKGFVAFAVRIFNIEGNCIRENRVVLQKQVRLGQTIDVEIMINIDGLSPNKYTMEFDLVCEHVAWFSQCGTRPFIISFKVK
ncbi:MAG: class I SAM-dependent methyltransferase [Nitrospirota bacterium]